MEGKKSQILMYEKIKMRLELEKQMKKVARMHFRNIMQHIWNRQMTYPLFTTA